MRKKGMAAWTVIGLLLVLIVGFISMVLFFAGSGMFPRIAQELERFGIFTPNMSIEEPPDLFGLAPEIIDTVIVAALGENFHFGFAAHGEFDIEGIFSADRIFLAGARLDDHVVPDGEMNLRPVARHITDGTAQESEIQRIDTMDWMRVDLWYQTAEGEQQTHAVINEPEPDSRVMLNIPFQRVDGVVIPVPIGELRYHGISTDGRTIRFRFVPAYDTTIHERISSIQYTPEGRPRLTFDE